MLKTRPGQLLPPSFCCLVLAVGFSLFGGLLVCGEEPPNGEAGEFVAIFDGKTLDGWKGDPVYWRVENGNLVGEITPETIVQRNTFLIWQGGEPADFELKLDYRISEKGNSGINYRSEVMDDHPFALTGYQSDIDGRNRYTGSNYEERGRTTLAAIGQKVTLPPVEIPEGPNGLRAFVERNSWKKAMVTETMGDKKTLTSGVKGGDWNRCRVVARGNVLQHFVNGVLMSEVTDNDPVNRRSSGHIGVQVHVGPPMKVEFRNIELKALGGPSGLNAEEAIKALGGHVFRDLKSKRVVEVKLSGLAGLADADLTHLAGFDEMTDLSLEETGITGAGLRHLSGLRKLEWLNLWKTKVDDEGLAQLTNLRALESLPVGGTAISDAGLMHLESLPNLRYLGLRDTAITDAGVKRLVLFPALEELNLRGTKVTDKCVLDLVEIKGLRKVWLGGTAIGEEGVGRLKRGLPKCVIDQEQ